MSIIEVKNLNVTYRSNNKRILAVDNISLSIEPGESLGILGESGSGKSTLAMAILRLLPEEIAEVTGEVHFMGKDLIKCTSEELKEIRWKKISVVFQKSMNGLSPVHKIGKQMEEIYKVHNPNENKEVIKSRIEKLFGMVKLPGRVFNLYPHELSGGMMQRVSIALSLLHEPPLVILDEATTALDVVTQCQILKELKLLEQEMNMATIKITHDVSVVATTCENVIVMYAGQLMEYGKVSDIITNPAHPYTQGLLKSFPTLSSKRVRLKGIPGSLPDLGERYKGCIFAPRCEHATDKCRNEKPEKYELPDGRTATCFLYGGGI